MRATALVAVIAVAALLVGVARSATSARNGLIYFDAFDTGSQSSDIYSIAAGGTGLKNLTSSSGANEREPAVSPSRKLVAYVTDLGGSTFHLALMSTAGTGAHVLSGAGGAAQDSPAWSPSGKLIAFSRCLSVDPSGGDCTRAQIATIGSNGRGVKVLSKAPAGAVDSQPAWAPNGKSLAFERTDASGNVTLWTVNSKGKSQRRIVNDGSAIDLHPSFLPNGRQLVFSSDAGGHEALWLVQPNGHGRKKLLGETVDPADRSTGAGTENPSVAPNGRSVVYTAAGDLWTVGINGKGAKQLTTAGGDNADWARG